MIPTTLNSYKIRSHLLNVFLILGMLLLQSFVKVNGQQPLRFDRIGRNDGLSQSSVNCMLRDRDGFMWFGTQDGLNLYDGTRFRVFQNQPGDSASLSNNYIVSICEDEEGLIWVGTMTGGLNCFNKHTERFRTFIHSEKITSISENTVWTVLPDGDGNIWAGTSKGLNRYTKKTGQFRIYHPTPSDSNSLTTDMVVSLFKDRRGRIWVGTVEGLCMIDKSKESFIRYHNLFEKELPGANLIWSISETPSGEIITGTNNGVYLLDVETGRYRRILGSPKDKQLVAWAVKAQLKEGIWVGTDRGLFRVEESGSGVKEFLYDPSNAFSIVDNNVWCLLADPSGFIWAGTNNGICKTKTSVAHFRLLSGDDGQTQKLSSSRVMAVIEDRSGNTWIGTDGGGLNCIRKSDQKVVVYNTSNSGLKNDNVWALAEDRDGNLYIGNYQGGLHKLNQKSDVITSYPFNTGNDNSLSNPRVLALLVGHNGKVWIGTRGGGLNCLDPLTGKFKVYQQSTENPSGFPSNTVLSLAQDVYGRLWAGTHEGGLALFLPGTEKFISFRNIRGDNFSLSDNNVWSIAFDKKGRIWVGTQGGVNVAGNPGETMKFRHFTTRDGLRSNTILGIQEDHEGNIWMSSFNGLAKLDLKSFESIDKQPSDEDSYYMFNPLFTLFDTDHGLQGLEFNQGAHYSGGSRLMYFGGNNGLNYFSDKDVKANDFRPPIVITGLKIFNKEVVILPENEKGGSGSAKVTREPGGYTLPEKITYIKELTLTYRESVISFEFAALDYSSPHKNQYAYKMVNFDENWNYMGTQNTATYTNLDPGDYTLLIRGSNSDGVWNPTERILKIRIIPPFWKTGWFILLAFIIGSLVIFLILRRVFTNQRRKALREKELIELQLKTIKSQIDPHFAFNAINTIAGFIYSEQPDITYDYFTRFARMIRNILEDNEKISRLLSEEIEFVRNYLELQKMRFREKLEYSIAVDEGVPVDTQVPKMIIQSYAENSIKHGLMHRKSGGFLSITVEIVESRLQVIIEDNGIGREKAAQMNPDTTRQGFRIMEQIIELYRKLYHTDISQKIEDLKDDAGNPTGTRVVLTIILLKESVAPKKFNLMRFFKGNGKRSIE